MNAPKVSNLESPRSGNPVANQFLITVYDEDGTLHEYFQSYSSIIAHKTYGKTPSIELDERYWNYSRTTSKYLHIFLYGCTRAKEGINSGEYKLVNLN